MPPFKTAFEPMLRGNVCDLFITPKLPGRLLPTVNFRPDAIIKKLLRKENQRDIKQFTANIVLYVYILNRFYMAINLFQFLPGYGEYICT